MSRHHRRRSWPRTLLLLVFMAAILFAVYHCVVRKPALAAAEVGVSSSAESSASAAASASETPANGTRKADDYTILISGVDDGNGGSDTNILVGFDAGSGKISAVSIPRDSAFYVKGKTRKINYAYNAGGADLLAESVSDGLGIPVDFSVTVNLKGFVALVDAIGGVDFDIPINMDYDDPVQGLSIHFSKGMQHLDGQEALEVVRFRHNSDGTGYGSEDLGRIGTQQAFLKAVAQQALKPSNLGKVSAMARIFAKYVKTDLTLGNLAWLGQEAIAIGTDNITFATLPGEWNGRRSVYLLDQSATLDLVNSCLNPYATERSAADLHLPD